MEEFIRIRLTDEQIEELNPLEKKVAEAASNNNKGAIMAQVSPGHGYAVCVFCEHYKILKMYEALGLEPPIYK